MFLAYKKISLSILLIKNIRYIKGIGHARRNLLFQHLCIPRVRQLPTNIIGYKKLRAIDKFICRFYTVRNFLNNINAIKTYGKFLIIGYKSIRKSQGLPCRGQQTQSNAKTAAKINNIIVKLFKRKRKVNLHKSTKVSQTKGRTK